MPCSGKKALNDDDYESIILAFEFFILLVEIVQIYYIENKTKVYLKQSISMVWLVYR